METKDTVALLTAAVKKRFGGSVVVAAVSRLTAGASSESWQFDITRTGQSDPERMVLRRPPGEFDSSDGDDLARRLAPGRPHEAAILRVLNETGLPVPEVIFELEADDDLGAGYVMNFVDGAPLPHRILKDPDYDSARRALPAQICDFRHELNGIDGTQFDFLPEQTASDQIRLFEDMLDWLELHHAGLELGLNWLKDYLPVPVPARLVHGDYRLSNYLITPDGLNAVIDWELSHRGDPLEDLGWPCVRSWRFANPYLPLAGLIDRRRFLDIWNTTSGQSTSLQELIFWEVLGNIKWAVLCLLQGHRFTSGSDTGLELAVIGRRVEEPVYDLIRLIEGKDGEIS